MIIPIFWLSKLKIRASKSLAYEDSAAQGCHLSIRAEFLRDGWVGSTTDFTAASPPPGSLYKSPGGQSFSVSSGFPKSLSLFYYSMVFPTAPDYNRWSVSLSSGLCTPLSQARASAPLESPGPGLNPAPQLTSCVTFV